MKRTGVYLSYKSGINQFNEPYDLSAILLLTKDNRVYFETMDYKFDPDELDMSVLESEFGLELDSQIGRHKIDGNHIQIVFPLNGINRIDQEYIELEGSFYDYKMILNFHQSNWSEKHEAYYKRVLMKALEFRFYSLIHKEFIDSQPDKPKIENKNSNMTTPVSEEKRQQYNQYKKGNKERNITIAVVFGFVGGLFGAITSGFSGFLIGAIGAIIVGFLITTFVDN